MKNIDRPEILLDENKEAERSEFYSVRGFENSPSHKLLIYGEDRSGNENYDLKVCVSTGLNPVAHRSQLLQLDGEGGARLLEETIGGTSGKSVKVQLPYHGYRWSCMG